MASIINHSRSVKKLYKTILKLNRGLPPELCMLGNEYVRDEFKKHKKCNPEEANIFIDEWTVYAITVAEQLGLRGPKTARKLGMNLQDEDLDQFRYEQIQQLYNLKIAATKPPINDNH
ncbi:hypothetical protein PPYR_01763 [Photinus pyralis]|uniref:Succinate dehydrogenase assembly factor 3 n=1 Tax=Photinus pyralis TaxID=7054 RepID=A0A1Y1NAM9_PHOPY|nr:succinate dehydrogenase assembly factor 3, mitochondrial [Photinus pyralis]KAB0804793.1 hypothetical protein PPYR_01763 [Photinus pyralis]